MAQAIDRDEQVARFRAEVLPRLAERYRPSKVLVFGSRARGDASRDSDLDVVVVSPAFAGMNWLDRMAQVREACDIRFDVELLCYTPDEYASKVRELGIVRVATLEGVDLLGGPPAGLAEPRRATPADVRSWVDQAARDLENARKSITIEAYEVAAFLTQQAVEKRLNAAWILVKQEVPPHTHSVTKLGEGLGVPPQVREALADLDLDYVAARYPDGPSGVPYQAYDRPTAERKVKAAEAVLAWLAAPDQANESGD